MDIFYSNGFIKYESKGDNDNMFLHGWFCFKAAYKVSGGGEVEVVIKARGFNCFCFELNIVHASQSTFKLKQLKRSNLQALPL